MMPFSAEVFSVSDFAGEVCVQECFGARSVFFDFYRELCEETYYMDFSVLEKFLDVDW